MRQPIHRGEGPLPRPARPQQRERFARARRELAERDGQLALDLSPACGGASGGAAPAAKMPEVLQHVTPPAPSRKLRSRPTLEEIRRAPHLVFD